MGFASGYLNTGPLFKKLFKETPDKDTGIIVVIPAFNEPDITNTLDSLYKCKEPECKTEVLIVVNAPSGSSDEVIENNKLTINRIESWEQQNIDCFFRLYWFNVGEQALNHWGVGMARKTGMDEAARRFDQINRPDGVIASLDADCRIDCSYFTALSKELLEKKGNNGCSIYFEHPLSGELPSQVYRSIVLYELHLRYYFQALKFTGFPYVHHTIGSAIAIKASAYIKAGGMNRRQAGEDFYFIQKLVPAGGFFNLYSTTIYPSPRVSERVPFGTGLAVGQLSMMKTPELSTYDFGSFCDLRNLFCQLDVLFDMDMNSLKEIFTSLPGALKDFIGEEEWIKKLTEIKVNTSNYDSYKKRFFNWFNMFKIVKYLNFAHQKFYNKKEVVQEAGLLLESVGNGSVINNAEKLLLFYRELEKNS
jgi:hypothetical protein